MTLARVRPGKVGLGFGGLKSKVAILNPAKSKPKPSHLTLQSGKNDPRTHKTLHSTKSFNLWAKYHTHLQDPPAVVASRAMDATADGTTTIAMIAILAAIGIRSFVADTATFFDFLH